MLAREANSEGDKRRKEGRGRGGGKRSPSPRIYTHPAIPASARGLAVILGVDGSEIQIPPKNPHRQAGILLPFCAWRKALMTMVCFGADWAEKKCV